jgi:ABC-2 type transport system permease protein
VTTARIHDTGYRRYEGVRLGPVHATRSLAKHTFQRVLGLRRPARNKILPFLSVGIAYLPAITFIGLLAFLPGRANRSFIPRFGAYYGFISAAIVLFVTFVAPEALCPDRRWRSLSLYLAAPLNRMTYLLAKAVAVASALLLVTLGPPLLYLIGRALENAGPRSFNDFVTTLLRIVVSGTVLALFYGSISMLVSSLTDRRAFAGAGTLLLLALSAAAGGVMARGIGAGEYWFLLNLGRTALDLVQRIFGLEPFSPGISTVAEALFVAAVTLFSSAVVVWRYKNLRVTR